MTSRQSILLAVLVVVVLLGGGGLFTWTLLVKPMFAKGLTLIQLESEVADRKVKQEQLLANLKKLARWKQQSLPADTDLARREYEKFLSDMLRESNFAGGSFTVTPKPPDDKSSPKLAGKQPIYTKLDFTVQGRAPLEGLVAVMQRFYTSGLLHQIKNFSVQRPLTSTGQQRPRDLDVTMTVEALVINGAEKRQFLIPAGRLAAATDLIGARQRGVGGLALAVLAASPGGPASPSRLAVASRNYESVAARNIFVGPPPPPPAAPTVEEAKPDTESLRFVFLTDITSNFLKTEAFLFDRLNNQKTRLRNSAAFNSFLVGDRDRPAVKGEVVKIDDRDVYFKTAENKFYVIHLGQSLSEALKKPLSEDQVKELTGAKAEADKPPAELP